jgi:hypothetical protein
MDRQAIVERLVVCKNPAHDDPLRAGWQLAERLGQQRHAAVGVPRRDRGAENSDQTRGKTGLCALVDHVGLQFGSLPQGIVHGSEK